MGRTSRTQRGQREWVRNDGEVKEMVIGVGIGQFYVDVWDGGPEFPDPSEAPIPAHRLPRWGGLSMGGTVETLRQFLVG